MRISLRGLLATATFALPSAAGAQTVPAPAAVAAAPLRIEWNLSEAALRSSCTAAIKAADAAISAITELPQAKQTFATTVLGIETAFADLNDNTAAQTFLSNVAGDAAVRKASNGCNDAQAGFSSEVLARPAVFAALTAAKQSGTATGDAQKKLTELWLDQSARAGAGLAPAQRSQFVALSAELTKLQTKYMENLAEDASTVVLSKEELAGLPPDIISTFKPSGSGFAVPVNESTIVPLLQNLSDHSARQAVFTTFYNRGGPENVKLLEQAIAVRDKMARLFGYSSWAGYVLADKMAQSPARVTAFLEQVDSAIKPEVRREFAGLEAQAGGPITAADISYYTNRLRVEKYNVDENALKNYFPVQHTVDSVLTIYSKLLGVSFKKIDAPDIWNPEVTAYEVYDAASGVLLGTFALDLYPRPGKYSHFANFPVIPRRVMPDGSVRAPYAVIVGNWARPAPGKPAVLTHQEVETFFHEFGHNMAAMLAAAPYESLNSGFRQDFVEAPSQMLENWVWDPAIIKEISSNVSSGAPMPDAMITKLVASRYVDNAMDVVIQIMLADVDMAYHSSGPHVDTTAVWQGVIDKLMPVHLSLGAHPQAGFGHLMSGYDAGYYGYLWSKVYAQDMFTAFAAHGLENPAVGMRYRTDILAPARTYEPDAEVQSFLGRPMSPAAFYAQINAEAH